MLHDARAERDALKDVLHGKEMELARVSTIQEITELEWNEHKSELQQYKTEYEKYRRKSEELEKELTKMKTLAKLHGKYYTLTLLKIKCMRECD